MKDPIIRIALRISRLTYIDKYSKEDSIFELYMNNIHNFEDVKPVLIQMEMKLQRERNVSQWENMKELIRDSEAQAAYA